MDARTGTPLTVGAATGTAAVGFFGAMLMFPPTRWLLTSTLLPKPGQGPSENLRENGFAHVYVVGGGCYKCTIVYC